MQPQNTEPSPGGMAVCPRHGLPYNPKLSTGCVQCRRTTDETVPGWVGPVAAVLCLAGAVALAIPFRDTIRRYFSPPAAASAALPPDAPPAHRRCVQAPGEAAALGAVMQDCQSACDAGWGASCRRLSGLCAPGSPVTPTAQCAPGPRWLLERACKSNDPLACALAEEQRKAEIFWKACDGGIGRSCADLVPYCDEGRAAVSDGAPTTAWAFLGSAALREGCSGGAARLYERGCSQGDWASCERPEAQTRLTPERLRSMLETACDRADTGACRRLASQVANADPGMASALVAYANDMDACTGAACSGVKRWRDRLLDERPKAQQQSAASNEQNCEQGQVSACWEAAEAHALGVGARQDPKRAAEFNERARALLKAGCGKQGGSCASADTLRTLEDCDRGDGVACLRVVQVQGGGTGGEAAPLFRRGVRALRADCDGRKGVACYQLGDLVRQGTLPGGEDAQIELLRQGCDGRHGLSCGDLAARLDEGRGVARNRPIADRMFRQAADLLAPPCDAGDTAACKALAGLYTDGKGVARDEAKAALYAGRAAAQPRPAASP